MLGMLFIWEKRNPHLRSKAPLSSSFSSWREGAGGGEIWRVGSRLEPFSPLESHFLSEGCQPLSSEIVAWSLGGMSLHTSQLRKPIVTPSHHHNKPPSHLLSTPPPPVRSQVTQTDWKGSSKKQPPAVSSSSLGAVAEGTVSRKASKDFCPFHTFSKFSVAEYLGMGTSTNAKKKKSVYE